MPAALLSQSGPVNPSGRLRAAILGCLLLLVSVTALGQPLKTVKHIVSFPADRQQVLLVRSEFPVSEAFIELKMPNWTPGSYLIRDFAADVNRFTATSAGGEVLDAGKTAKDRWRIETPGLDTLVVNYEVFTPGLKPSLSWSSSEFSLINGASVFMYSDASRGLPQYVDVEAGETRGGVFTALPAVEGGNQFRAADYDELVDNPVAVANAPRYSFSLENQDYILLNVAENRFWDGRQAAADIEKIVEATQWFWQVNPLERPYWFMNFISGTHGGLEHDHSTVLMTGHAAMRDRDTYIRWLGLVSHEFFHVWNVRRMRPAGLEEIDYQSIQYTDQLWLAEGLTSYYDNLMLARAGLIDFNEYLVLLAKDIHRLESTPGRLEQSVTDASFDAWIRHYQPNANTLNSTISYYTKGAMIGFVIDTWLRSDSRGKRSLDEVMQRMYGQYSDTPYTESDFIQVVRDVGGEDAGEFVQSILNTASELDVDTALAWYGLELVRQPGEGNGEEGDEAVESGLGVVWEIQNTGLQIDSVRSGSSAETAGLIPGDEILAIGGYRLKPGNRKKLISSFNPGEQTHLLVSRRERVLELNITMGVAVADKYGINLRSDYRPSHIKRLERLLGQKIR